MTGCVGVMKEKIEKVSSVVVREKREKPTPVEIKEEVATDGVDYEKDTEFDITLSKESLIAKSESNELAPRCSFKYSNLKEISDNRMLNNNIIKDVQKMMKKQFSQANSLQDPVLGQTINLNVTRNLPFVQVLHDGRIHNIAVSPFNYSDWEKSLIYSLFKGRVCYRSKRQISALINCRNKNIKMNILPVQQ